MPTPIQLRVTTEDGREQTFDGTLLVHTLAQSIAAQLPLAGAALGFGGEVALKLEAFEPPEIDAEEGGDADPQPTNEVQLGDLAYWSPGNTLNFYCGDTPLTSVRPLKEGERNPLISE